MFNWLAKLHLVFRYGPELSEMLSKERLANRQKEMDRKRTHLNLCYEHQQESNHSHFSEHNCHHCQLLTELARYKDVT